jgi:hypothetical protein
MDQALIVFGVTAGTVWGAHQVDLHETVGLGDNEAAAMALVGAGTAAGTVYLTN